MKKLGMEKIKVIDVDLWLMFMMQQVEIKFLENNLARVESYFYKDIKKTSWPHQNKE